MPISQDDGPEDIPFRLNAIDRAVLSSTDNEFHLQTWEDLKVIISKNDLHLLKRRPSDLRRYLTWSRKIKSTYGSIPNYIMRERLKWTPLGDGATISEAPGVAKDAAEAVPGAFQFAVHNATPFTDERDYKILPNDWPYGLETGIVHLIVWLKGRLETEAEKGDMTPTSRRQVEEFVQRKFVTDVEGLPGTREKVQWFKNWTALQSVPGLEHVHVLVRDVPDEVILSWTEGEVRVQ